MVTAPTPAEKSSLPSTVSILVADDFSLWRAKVRHILRARPEWKITCEACDGEQAVQKAAALQPDIVLLDLGMPVLSGIEAARRILEDSPKSRVVFLTQCTDPDIMNFSLQLGAEAYLLKARAASDLLPAIEAALHQPNESQCTRSWRAIAEEVAQEKNFARFTELVDELDEALSKQDINGNPKFQRS
jgi:DNA-binding NarL/FixJ family response regulator